MWRRRKERHTGQESSQKSMGEYFRRERPVEIIDDDEIEEINAKEASISSRSTRFTRRQKRLEEEDSQSSSVTSEDWELQEALRISKVEAEAQDERRRLHGDPQDVEKLLQVEIEPIAVQDYPRTRAKRSKTSTESAVAEDDEKERENTASPDLFSTPPEDKNEQLSYIKTAEKIESDEDEELACSPVMPVTNRPTEATVCELDKDPVDIKFKDVLPRQSEDQPRRKLTLRRTREKQSKEEENDVDNDVIFDEADKKKQAQETESPTVLRVSLKDDIAKGKRKLMNDDNDTTVDEEPFQVTKEKRKRTRVNLSSDDSDEVDAETEGKTGTKRKLDWLENFSSTRNGGVASEEAVRNNEPEQVGEPRNPLQSLRLTRRYKKSRRRPNTMKEAMKANLYFAPPGFDLPAYTKLIIKMLERYRKCLHTAQTIVKIRIPWGDPVRVGTRQGDTLDSKTAVGSTRKYRATATTAVTSVSRQGKDTAAVKGTPRALTVAKQAELHSEVPVSDRKRTLRSLQEVSTLETASASRAASSTSEPLKVDSESDSDDQELRSYIDTELSAKPEKASETSQTGTNAIENQNNVGMEFGANVTLDSVADDNKLKTYLNEGKKTFGRVSENSQTKRKLTGNQRNVETCVRSNSGTNDKDLKSYLDEVSKPPRSVTKHESNIRDEFGANVVLNSSTSETESRIGDNSLSELPISGDAASEASTSTHQTLNSGMSGHSRGDIGDEHTEENKVQLMDSEVQCIRPPKRRSVLRVLQDDSTDDESDSSQSLFASLEKPSCSEGSSKEVASSTKRVKAKQTVDDSGDFNNKTFNYALRDSSPPLQYSETNSPVKIAGAQTVPGSGDESLVQQQTAYQSVLAVQTKEPASLQTINASDPSVASSSKVRGTTSKDIEQGDVEFLEMSTTGSSSSQNSRTLRRSRSEVAAKAAAAAERRQQGVLEIEPEKACSSSASVDTPLPRQAEPKASDQPQPENRVECPLCFRHFSPSDIETHASDCQGQLSPTGPSPLSSLPFIQQVEETATSRTESQVRNNQTLAENSAATWKTTGIKKELRDLRVVLQRSPAADRKLRDKVREDRAVRTARKNMTFQQDNESSATWSGSGDQSDTIVEGITTSPEKMAPKWMRASSSKGNFSKILDAFGEFIPLNSQPEDRGSGSDQPGLTSPAKQRQDTPRTRNTAMESDEHSSDADEIMAQYGAPRSDKQRSASPKMDIDEGSDEDDKALTLLGKKNLRKRQLSRPETSKSKKACTGRSSDSEDSDDSFILCTMCNKKLAKADFDKHVEEEIAERNRMPRKVDGTAKINDAKQRQDTPRTRNTAMESDEHSSDADEIMAQYGAQRSDKQRSASPKMDIDEGSDENDKALTLLGKKNLRKRQLSRPETSKSKKACTGRSSDSEDSDDSFILCTMCSKKLAKADFDKHVEEEIAERNRMPRKVEVVLVNDKSGIPAAREGQRRFETSGGVAKSPPTESRNTAAANVDDNTAGIDWDEVSNSPIKCFQFTGNTDSGVDFENQFAHLKEGKGRTRQSRNTANATRGTGQKGARGPQRRRYFYRGGNQFNKFRGRRRKKK